MAILELEACPICQARDSLAHETIQLEGRTHTTYECLECGSELAWLGDDLWLEADRWAYQKVGRADMTYLLHRSLAASQLQELASREPPATSQQTSVAGPREVPQRSWSAAAPTVPPAVPAEEAPPGEPAAEQGSGVAAPGAAAAMAMAARVEDERPEEPRTGQSSATTAPGAAAAMPIEQAQPQEPPAVKSAGAAVPVQGDWAGQPPAQRRRSKGSPFLVISVALTLLCLVCSSAAMIIFSNMSGGTPQIAPPADTPVSEATPTETPSPTDTPMPTETPAPAPTEPPAVLFQGVTDYVSGTGTHYVVGEVLNTGGDNLRFVEVLASFYDADGQLVGTGSTFTELSVVEAESSAPFKLATLNPPPSLATYKLRTDYLTTGQAPLRLEVTGHYEYVDDSGRHHIVGEVRNPNDFAIKFPEIVATYYTATHQVVRVETIFAQLDSLQPGEISPFEVILVDPPADLHHYALQTEAVPE